MPKYITIKYYDENELAKKPYHAPENSAWYGVFAAEAKTFLPNSIDIILLELRWAIPVVFTVNYFHDLEF